MSQVCNVCNIEKPLADFYIRKETGKHRKDCKSCARTRCSKYYDEHRTSVNAYKLRWEQENYTERRKLVKKRYRHRHHEKVRQYMRDWHDSHREHSRLYSISNRMTARIRAHNRRELVRADGGVLSLNLAETLMVLQKGKCRICKKSLDRGCHLDHIVPLVKGGTHSDSNIQLLCPACNYSKGAKDPHIYAQELGMLFL